MIVVSVTSSILVWVVVACLMVAVSTDLALRIIPNTVVVVVMACGLGARALSGPYPLMLSVLSATGTLAVLSVLGGYGLLGWGDVKLIAAVTLIVPANHVAALLFGIILAGGVLSCCYLCARFVLRRVPASTRGDAGAWVLGRLAHRESARIRTNEPMPYAFAILGGVAYGLAIG
jgi:prepilin peptidase CpaA